MSLQARAIAASTVLFAGPLMHAQKAPESEIEDIRKLLQTPVQSAARRDQSLREAPGIITSISSQDLEAIGARTLADALKMVPGIQMFTRRNGRDMVWIRGIPTTYNNEVLLLVDGVPQREAVFGEWSPDEEIPLNQIDRVEITRGPGSALYGGNAYAGIISIFTKPAGDTVQASFGGGQLGGLRFEGLAGHGAPGDGASLAASTMRSAGPRMARDRSGNPTDHKDHVASSSLRARLEMSGFFLGLSHTDFTTDYPLYASGETKPQTYRTTTATLGQQFQWGELSFDPKAYVFHVSEFHDYRKVNPATGTLLKLLTRDMESLNFGLDAQFTWRASASHVLVFGAWAEDMRAITYYEQESVPPFSTSTYSSWLDQDRTGAPGNHGASTFNYAVFAQSEWKLFQEKLALTGGLRMDHNENFGAFFSPRLGLVYDPDGLSTFKLLWGRAFKPPTFRQTVMYRSDGLSPGNPKVGPERIRTVDLEWSRRLNAWAHLRVDLFNEALTDFIESQSYHPYENSGRKRVISGWELGLDLIGSPEVSWPRMIKLSANVTGLTQAYDEGSGARMDVPYVAHRTASAGLWLNGARMDAYLGVSAQGRRASSPAYHSLVAASESRGQDFLGFSSRLDFNLVVHTFHRLPVRVELAAHNLLDRRIMSPDIDPEGYYEHTQEGRTLSFKIGLSY
jgi:outer membrane receptor for ferrienterochelin and colicins